MTPLASHIPQLETDRLVLRAPRVEEFPTYCALFTSARAKYIGEFDAQSAWSEYESEMGHWAFYGYGPFHVERRDDAALVGGVSLLNHDHYPEIELGWHLYDGYEGRGYATEAAAGARNWAFEEHNLPTLVSYIDADNAALIKVAQRLGATLDPNAAKVDPEDVVYRHSPERMAA